MRIFTLVALGIFTTGAATPLHAQAPAAAEPAGKYFFNISLGGQSRDQTFSDTSTFTIYGEDGAVGSAQSIGGGTLFDIGAGVRVWRNAAVGLAYSTLTNKNDATVSVRVPSPAVFGASRTATVTASDLEHSEKAVHLQFMWMVPVTDKFELAVMAGPSFFSVRQTVATVRAPQDISDPPPFDAVTISSVTLTDVEDSPVGVHVGVDGTYLLRTISGVRIGVGGFLRFAGASFDLPTSDGSPRDPQLKVGGPQGAIGLRLGF